MTMPEPLTIERFRALAEAYGGSVARWPEPVRAAARELATTDPRARDILTQATALDEALDLWVIPPPGRALADRIVRSAAVRDAKLGRRARLWWGSIGLAAALAGVATGALAAASFSPEAPAESSTVFGDVGEQEG